MAASVPGLPKKAVGKVHFVINLAQCLPLRPDHVYSWVVHVDSVTRPDWRTSFYVLDRPSGPVVG